MTEASKTTTVPCNVTMSRALLKNFRRRDEAKNGVGMVVCRRVPERYALGELPNTLGVAPSLESPMGSRGHRVRA